MRPFKRTKSHEVKQEAALASKPPNDSLVSSRTAPTLFGARSLRSFLGKERNGEVSPRSAIIYPPEKGDENSPSQGTTPNKGKKHQAPSPGSKKSNRRRSGIVDDRISDSSPIPSQSNSPLPSPGSARRNLAQRRNDDGAKGHSIRSDTSVSSPSLNSEIVHRKPNFNAAADIKTKGSTAAILASASSPLLAAGAIHAVTPRNKRATFNASFDFPSTSITSPPATEQTTVSPPAEPEDERTEYEKLEESGITTYIEAGKKMISAGTISNIIQTLVAWLTTEPDRKDVFALVYCFILCHRKYLTSSQLLDMIITMWDLLEGTSSRSTSPSPPAAPSPPSKSVQIRAGLMFFLAAWIEIRFSDFQDADLSLNMEKFVKRMSGDFRRPLTSKITAIAHRKLPEKMYLFKPSSQKVQMCLGKFNIFDIDPEQVADQWTLLDMRNFMKITTHDFLKPGPHWDKMLHNSALLSRWVASEIVQVSNLSKRAEVMQIFLEIALKCLENKNFNGLMGVWGGLNSLPVHRLTKTKKKISRKHHDIYNSLNEKLIEDYNFFQLRKAIEKQKKDKQPLLPWFEMVNKYRNWADQYPDYIVEPSDAEDNAKTKQTEDILQVGKVELPEKKIENSDDKDKGKEKERDDSCLTPRSDSQTRRDKPQPNQYLNFSKIALLGQQILEFTEYQTNLSVLELHDPEMKNKGDSTVRTFLKHLPGYDDETLWKLSLTCETSDPE